MTPQIQFEPSRRQQRLKWMGRGSEAERKRLFAIGRFLKVQEDHRPRPFLNTALGKLPPKLRVMIYQHLLVMPWSQADRDNNTKNAKSSSTASQPFIHLKKSSLSTLRTCRQIKLETHPILLKSGIPYFANACELLSYLTGIGSTGRLRLEAFRIGDLLYPEPFEHRNRPPNNKQSGIRFFGGDFSLSYARKDPDVMGAFSLLTECESLHTIYMDMKQGEEFTHWIMLRHFTPGGYIKLHIRELHDWFVLQLEDPKLYTAGGGFRGALSMYRALVSSGRPMGRDVLVKVHINPLSAPKPFSTTRLGKLPQNLRTQIYHELVTTPSIHIRQGLFTQDVRARTRYSYRPLKSSTTHVHLQASYLAVLRVCRSMYIEAHPIFYERQSYYTDNAKEFQQLVRLSVRTFLQPPFDSNVITSLCVKNIVS